MNSLRFDRVLSSELLVKYVFFSLGMRELSFTIFTGAQLPRLGFSWSQTKL